MIPTRAQSLHGGFFGGEAGRVTLHPIRLGIAIANLAGRENTLQKTLSEALDGTADAGDFGDVDACAYDHVRKSKE